MKQTDQQIKKMWRMKAMVVMTYDEDYLEFFLEAALKFIIFKKFYTKHKLTYFNISS